MSEEMFRSALLHSPIGMALVSPDGRWIEVNPALCKIVGYSQSELLATDFQTINHPDDLQTDVNAVRQMLDRQVDSYEMEKRYLHKNGNAVWIQRMLRWFGTRTAHRAISFHKSRTLPKENEPGRHCRNTMPSCFSPWKWPNWRLLGEHDVATDRMTVDERFFKYYGMPPAEAGGFSLSASDYIRKFVHPEDAPAIAEEIASGMATTDPNYTRQFEKRIIRTDGSIGVMLTRFTIAKDGAGRTVKAYGANQDITEQKRVAQQQDKLEEQLRQAQKMEALGTLAGGTAHEFNNMLGIILGYSELIRAELDASHPCQTDLDEILKAGQRAKEIIQQTLTFSRQQKQPREQVQLTDVLRKALKQVRATLPATVALHEEITGGDPFILANPTQIHQVLMNICINAWHAMEERAGTIRIALRTVKPGREAGEIHPNLRNITYVHLSVADTAKGMEPATLTRIFEPFFTTKGPVQRYSASGWLWSMASCRPTTVSFSPKAPPAPEPHFISIFQPARRTIHPLTKQKNGNQKTRLKKRSSHLVGG